MKKYKDWLIAAAGLLLLALGNWQIGGDTPLAYICIGVGSGLFGQGIGEIVSRRALRGSPEIQRQLEIARKDERNMAIADHAKSKAFDLMTFSFGALMLSFALMRVQMAVVWMLVLVYFALCDKNISHFIDVVNLT